MNISSAYKPFEFMSKLEKYQHILRRRFQEVENKYYPLVDDLCQKLSDMEGVDVKKIPDFDLYPFSFIKDWEEGDISSSHVLSILQTMNMEKTAKTTLTRRLSNYLLTNKSPTVADYVNPCVNLIMRDTFPLYVSYLNFLRSYFEKLSEIDRSQEKVTWLEQVHSKDMTVEKRIADLTLNQVIKQLEYQVTPFTTTKYFFGDNVICLDENLAKGEYCIHWIFAPKSYIDELKILFNIKDDMSIKQEANYVSNLIKAYVK
jgi:hypothetical protein